MDKVNTKIAVTTDNNKLMVTLEITNNTKDAVYIEKHKVFSNGKIRNRLFHLISNGEKIKYSGRMIKRKPPKLEDYIKLESKESFSNFLELTSLYKFKKGEHNYEIIYKAKHSTLNTPNTGGSWKTESNIVSFIFNK